MLLKDFKTRKRFCLKDDKCAFACLSNDKLIWYLANNVSSSGYMNENSDYIINLVNSDCII